MKQLQHPVIAAGNNTYYWDRKIQPFIKDMCQKVDTYYDHREGYWPVHIQDILMNMRRGRTVIREYVKQFL
jgi:hypothetical protein